MYHEPSMNYAINYVIAIFSCPIAHPTHDEGVTSIEVSKSILHRTYPRYECHDNATHTHILKRNGVNRLILMYKCLTKRNGL